MLSKTNIQIDKHKVLLTALGAWVMTFATLMGTNDMSRRPAVVSNFRPSYAAVDSSNVLSRNDNENETVHMPTEFDIGLQTVAIGGRK